MDVVHLQLETATDKKQMEYRALLRPLAMIIICNTISRFSPSEKLEMELRRRFAIEEEQRAVKGMLPLRCRNNSHISYLLKVGSRLDLPTSKDGETWSALGSTLTSQFAWNFIEGLVQIGGDIVSLLSRGLIFASLIGRASSAGNWVILSSFAAPFFQYIIKRQIASGERDPLSLATLEFIRSQASSFAMLLGSLRSKLLEIKSHITGIKQYYEADHFPNIVRDGHRELVCPGKGLSVEFKDVAFSYPGSKKKAIQHVSFKLNPGDLCVIVGGNGQGKSSILKLLTRLYDATAGTVYIQGEPIQDYKLHDLRKATSVLFQDFALFPLSIEENIRLSHPSTALDELDEVQKLRVYHAAEMGGATAFISKLPHGYETVYTDQPYSDMCASFTGPEGDQIFSQVTSRIKSPRTQTPETSKSSPTSFSGGELQRLALSRTFMKPSSEVGLWIFDELALPLIPSQNLFQRLKELRGNKTMVFSTHRFGHLTKHADVILYMEDSTILESGNHDELMAKNGAYARLYNIQASAFA
ncbi:P-loop containing nucleoside triphosphate hydrolase protein [Clavulina sp. PMI_390]|nr:P-loop containing nucleoside triphosphate hydrolase protein [Clavulina sp. PMI_390]